MGVKLRYYFDACCVNRLTDDQEQERIREEAEAVENIVSLVNSKEAVWVGSAVLRAELMRNPHPERRSFALDLLAVVGEWASVEPDTVMLALNLEQEGFGRVDSLHLAVAAQSRVDVFFTTDDRL